MSRHKAPAVLSVILSVPWALGIVVLVVEPSLERDPLIAPAFAGVLTVAAVVAGITQYLGRWEYGLDAAFVITLLLAGAMNPKADNARSIAFVLAAFAAVAWSYAMLRITMLASRYGPPVGGSSFRLLTGVAGVRAGASLSIAFVLAFLLLRSPQIVSATVSPRWQASIDARSTEIVAVIGLAFILAMAGFALLRLSWHGKITFARRARPLLERADDPAPHPSGAVYDSSDPSSYATENTKSSK